MTGHYDARETQAPEMRERDLFARLPAAVARSLETPGWRVHLGSLDARAISSREALAELPVLRKSDLSRLQKENPPFAGFVSGSLGAFGRLFTSPGPIFEPEGREDDAWRAARALFAVGCREGDIVLNTFSYHLTPGGFIMDSAARALKCPVIPAGPGNTEQTLDVVQQLRPSAYCGTPDFLKILLDKAGALDRDASSIRRALVSGAAFPPSLQTEMKARGVDAYQTYATADVGVIAYESPAREGLIINEDIIVEIVRPGTGDPVAEGEVGEIVVTTLDPHHPMIRLALGDLTAALPGVSSCGRTNMRIKGWMGRADQTAKVKGMFVRPEQIAEIGKRHPELAKLRLVVSRANEQDEMKLRAETAAPSEHLAEAVAESVIALTKLRGAVEFVAPGALPNDGKVIADERPIG
ncbi:phenylacetate--CoA ligase family protein [Terrarubrum flagellatum]|uniref:phenylacetate--CoA ligase family protein n=1 Tax=Terrirubrum flagellatum TaxID=2895980 RepID=UPI0031453715